MLKKYCALTLLTALLISLQTFAQTPTYPPSTPYNVTPNTPYYVASSNTQNTQNTGSQRGTVETTHAGGEQGLTIIDANGNLKMQAPQAAPQPTPAQTQPTLPMPQGGPGGMAVPAPQQSTPTPPTVQPKLRPQPQNPINIPQPQIMAPQPQITTPQPVAPQPIQPQAVIPQTTQPIAPQPMAPQPATPTAPQAVVPQPTTPQPTTTEPTTPQPTTTEPTTPQPPQTVAPTTQPQQPSAPPMTRHTVLRQTPPLTPPTGVVQSSTASSTSATKQLESNRYSEGTTKYPLTLPPDNQIPSIDER